MNSHFSERRKKILQLIHQNKNMTIRELSKYFNVSIPTLYRDLNNLEEDRLVQKFHGIVTYIEYNEKDHEYFYRSEVNAQKKKYIAKKAIEFIENGDNVFIDASTTCLYLCKELKNSDIENLTIYTNGLYVPCEFLTIKGFNVINFGGILDRDVVSYVKNEPHFFLENIKYLKYFGSSYAFSPEFGAMDNLDLWEIEVKKEVLKFCHEVVLLIDSSKFNLKGTYNWLEVNKINKIITDPEINKKFVDLLSFKEVELIY